MKQTLRARRSPRRKEILKRRLLNEIKQIHVFTFRAFVLLFIRGVRGRLGYDAIGIVRSANGNKDYRLIAELYRSYRYGGSL